MDDNITTNQQSQTASAAVQPEFDPKKMKACKSCGQPISKKAKVCPNCGAKNKKPLFKKPLFWILIVIIAIAVIGVASSGDTAPTSTVEPINSSGGNAANTNESNAEPIGDQKILPGNAVSTDEIKISYISCNTNYTDYEEYMGPESGNKVVRAEFTFENISSEDVSLMGFECYADGKKCEEFYGADDFSSPALETISAGRTFNSVVYYEVPKSAEECELEFESDFWSDDKIIFVVK